jgi:hypothetical protein
MDVFPWCVAMPRTRLQLPDNSALVYDTVLNIRSTASMQKQQQMRNGTVLAVGWELPFGFQLELDGLQTQW